MDPRAWQLLLRDLDRAVNLIGRGLAEMTRAKSP